jgi:hypothetical protein
LSRSGFWVFLLFFVVNQAADRNAIRHRVVAGRAVRPRPMRTAGYALFVAKPPP